ncbi:MAG TPA: protein kinase, partial [Acidimicrobiales bacterium]|nr:protein kinase [Acidimicrobiales bacterium]
MSNADGSSPVVQLPIEGIADAVLVGHGPASVVYRATQWADGRVVAVKVLNSPLTDEESRHRFDQEGQMGATLAGLPHVAAPLRSGLAPNGQAFIISEFAPGGSFGDRVLTTGPLPWLEVLDLGIKIAGALGQIHARGMIHGAIKPENILLSSANEPLLGDFGAARLRGPVANTPAGVAQSSPEAVSGAPLTTASDVWSLAASLSTLVSGEAPFQFPGDESVLPIITRIMSGESRDLAAFGVPPVFAGAIVAALAKNPAARPPSGHEMLQLLQSVRGQLSAGGAPVAPAPVSPGPAVPPGPVSAPPLPPGAVGPVSTGGVAPAAVPPGAGGLVPGVVAGPGPVAPIRSKPSLEALLAGNRPAAAASGAGEAPAAAGAGPGVMADQAEGGVATVQAPAPAPASGWPASEPAPAGFGPPA